MSSAETPQIQERVNQPRVAYCSVRLHPIFGEHNYILQRNGLRAEPIMIVPEVPNSPARFPLHDALEEKLLASFKNTYPNSAFPHISSTFRETTWEPDGQRFDWFEITLPQDISAGFLFHPSTRPDLILMSDKQIKEGVEQHKRYRILPPNHGWGHLEIDPRSIHCIQDLTPYRFPKLHPVRRFARKTLLERSAVMGEVDYRIRPDDLDHLGYLVQPRVIERLEKNLYKSRLTEKAFLVLQGLLEGVTTAQLLKPTKHNPLLIQLLGATAILLTEIASERYATVAKKETATALGPVMDELRHTYTADARLHGMSPIQFSDYLNEIASALAETEAVPPSFLETGPATLAISAVLFSQHDYTLLAGMVGSFVVLQKYLEKMLNTNPFRSINDTIHTYGHLLAGIGRYLPLFAASFGLTGPQVAAASLIAGHGLESLSDITPTLDGHAAIIRLRDLMGNLHITISTEAQWQDHCQTISHTQQQKDTLPISPPSEYPSAWFSHYSVGIENTPLLCDAHLILHPGLNTLEMRRGMGLSRILGVLGERIVHSRGNGIIYTDDEVLDIHANQRHIAQYVNGGNIEIDERPQFPPNLSPSQLKSYLKETGFFTEQEIQRFVEKGPRSTDNRFFRKLMALACAGSWTVLGPTRVLFLDNMDEDIENPAMWNIIASFLKRLSDRGILIMMGCREGFLDSKTKPNTPETYRDILNNYQISLSRNTLEDGNFIPINSS